jgi:hypothetical protein
VFDWYHNQALEHQKEMLREAEQHYRIRVATSATRNPFGLRSRGMVWLGSKLVQVGRTLQARGGFSIAQLGPSRITQVPNTSFGIGLPPTGNTYIADVRRSKSSRNGTYSV